MFSFGKNKKPTEEKLDRVLKNPKILEVNLIKDEIVLSFDWKKHIKNLVVALLVVVLIIAELYFGLSWWEKDEESRLESLRAQIKVQTKDVNDFRKAASDALAYKDKTIEVGNLLNNHVYWTNFFTWLEKNTLSTVSYGNFSGDLTGEYSFSGSASSFADVSWQVKTLHDDPMTLKAQVETATASNGESEDDASAAQPTIPLDQLSSTTTEVSPAVNFSLFLQVNPDIFKK